MPMVTKTEGKLVTLPTQVYEALKGKKNSFIVKAVNSHEAYHRIIDALRRWTDHGNMPKYDSLMPDSDQTFGRAIEEAIAQAEGK